MNYCFLLTGSNAAGKTTTVETALAPFYPQSGVLDERIMNIRADNDGRFKGDAQDQRRVLTELWLGPTPILMVEGTRINTPLMDVAKKYKTHTTVVSAEEMNVGEVSVPPAGKLAEPRTLVVLMALQKAEVMRAHLKARCEKKGKKFRDDYWSLQKLEYEGWKRYPNSFKKNGVEPLRYVIGPDYAECQQIVDYLQARFREVLGQ